MAKGCNNDHDSGHQFTKQDIKILEERRMKRLSGESKLFNWEHVKEMIGPKKNR